jgi:hypothetical protein
MWVYIGEGHVVYEYTPTRAGVNPSRFCWNSKASSKPTGMRGTMPYESVALPTELKWLECDLRPRIAQVKAPA